MFRPYTFIISWITLRNCCIVLLSPIHCSKSGSKVVPIIVKFLLILVQTFSYSTDILCFRYSVVSLGYAQILAMVWSGCVVCEVHIHYDVALCVVHGYNVAYQQSKTVVPKLFRAISPLVL
jgi:hypothetical protein